LYLLYLDESGTPTGWQNQNNFVIGGVAVHEGQIHTLANELDKIQEKYFPGLLIPIEFHADAIRHGKGPHFKQFTPDIREEIIKEVYEMIDRIDYGNLVVFASAINISAVADQNKAGYTCFEEICKNFNQFLYHQYRKRNLNKGLLIIDRTRDKEYLYAFNEFRKASNVRDYLPSIIDIPYFASSNETRMLQLADFCSNAIYRYYESNITDYFDIIARKFYRGRDPEKTLSLSHITKNKKCECEACNRFE
jgi:hypothetical protein